MYISKKKHICCVKDYTLRVNSAAQGKHSKMHPTHKCTRTQKPMHKHTLAPPLRNFLWPQSATMEPLQL